MRLKEKRLGSVFLKGSMKLIFRMIVDKFEGKYAYLVCF